MSLIAGEQSSAGLHTSEFCGRNVSTPVVTPGLVDPLMPLYNHLSSISKSVLRSMAYNRNLKSLARGITSRDQPNMHFSILAYRFANAMGSCLRIISISELTVMSS